MKYDDRKREKEGGEILGVGIKDVEKLIIELYPRRAVVLLGAPGIGKSETVKRAAKKIANKLGKEFVEYDDKIAEKILKEPEKYFVFNDLRLTEVEPSDLIGIPRNADTEYVRYKPLMWAEVMNKCAGVLFLDEITNVQRVDVIAAAYKLVYDKRAGYIKFNNNVMVIAAGNAPEHSSIANYLPAPLINRCYVIKVDPPTVEEWIEYMNENYEEWDRRVGAYLMYFKGELIMKPESEETLNAFATPRQWTALATDIVGVEDKERIYTMAEATVGAKVASKLATFVTTRIPSIEEIIARPSIIAELDSEKKFLAAYMIAQNMDKKGIAKVLEWLAENLKEIAVVTAILADRKKLREVARKVDKFGDVLVETLKITAEIQ